MRRFFFNLDFPNCMLDFTNKHHTVKCKMERQVFSKSMAEIR